MTSTDWERVSRANPCPICNKPDWCLVSKDGSTAICPRVESDKRAGDAGWIHVINPLLQPKAVSAPVVVAEPLDIDWQRGVDQCVAAMEGYMYDHLVSSTGLRKQGLVDMQVGWSAKKSAYTFPMRASDGVVIGIRLRTPDGNKFAVKGSRAGLFYVGDPPSHGNVYVAEGPTDTLALHQIGLPAVGRPSCNGGGIFLSKMLCWKHDVVIVADNDKPGKQGAKSIACLLKPKVARVRIMYPSKGSDVKDWVVGHGASKQVVELVANQARAL